MKTKKTVLIIICTLSIISILGIILTSLIPQNPPEHFGIYLRKNNALIISKNDIISYNKTNYEFMLTEHGLNEFKTLEPLNVYGEPFVMKLNGKELYNGSFWPAYSSVPCTDLMIMIDLPYQNSIRVEAGMSPEFFRGVDTRNNTQLCDYFESIGKLII